MKFLFALLTLLPLLAWSASFDCQKASSDPEKMVCADAELSKLDEQLAQTYRDALQALSKQDDKSQLIGQQKHWIADVRDRCKDAACLRTAYQSRIQLLKQHEGAPPEAAAPLHCIKTGDQFKCQDITYSVDPMDSDSWEISLYNAMLRVDGQPGKITGCTKGMVLSPQPYDNGFGYLPRDGSADITSVICTLKKDKAHPLVRICHMGLDPNYAIEALGKDQVSDQVLADFAYRRCELSGPSAPSPQSVKPIDCTKAGSAAEKMICADPELTQLDTQLTQIYRDVLTALADQTGQSPNRGDILVMKQDQSALGWQQKNWITYVRNLCKNAACLRQAYQSRIQLLKDSGGRMETKEIDSKDKLPEYVRHITIYEGDLNNEIVRFTRALLDNNKPGTIISCNKLIDVILGINLYAYISAGICTLEHRGTRTLMQVCYSHDTDQNAIKIIKMYLINHWLNLLTIDALSLTSFIFNNYAKQRHHCR
jgi:uncharacterized protein